MPLFTSGLIVACLISLFATVTNLVPVSVLGPGACLVIFLISVWNGAIGSDVARWAAIFIGYAAVNCALYWPQSFLEPNFYRYDGNMFLSFAPYLLVGLLVTRVDIDRLLFHFLLFSTAICAPVVAYDFASHQLPSHGLFVAHNAFGGFLMFTSAIAIAYLCNSRTLTALMLTGLHLGMLGLSYSRGSMLGIIGAVLAYWCFRRGRMWPLWAALALIVVVQTAILSRTYPIYASAPEGIRELIDANASSGQEANILIRALKDWPHGLDLFFHSPIFGAGFGSMNDRPHDLKDFALIQFKNSVLHRYTSGHAHHSYIHWLGEIGLVGLVLFLGFWSRVHKFIVMNSPFPLTRDAIYIGFWAITFAAFTEHRLPTPSNAFPLALAFLLYTARLRATTIPRPKRARSPGAKREPSSARITTSAHSGF